jgi:hypothetical protein
VIAVVVAVAEGGAVAFDQVAVGVVGVTEHKEGHVSRSRVIPRPEPIELCDEPQTKLTENLPENAPGFEQSITPSRQIITRDLISICPGFRLPKDKCTTANQILQPQTSNLRI